MRSNIMNKNRYVLPPRGAARAGDGLQAAGGLGSVNLRSGGRSAPWSAAATSGLLAGAAILTPLTAWAEFTGRAAVTGQFESNSNVFDLNTGVAPPANGDPRRGDTYFAYGAQFDLQYLLGRQQFFASAGITELNYQRHTDLNHDDYRLDAGMNWTLTDLLDGKIDVKRVHAMVPFYDLLSTTLSVQTQQREEALVGLRVSSQWRLEADGYTSKLDEPIPQAPNLSLTESSGQLSVKYTGVTRLTSGLYAGYLKGSYAGINPGGIDVGGITVVTDSDYHQYSGGFAATYLSPRSTFEGQLGYSRRTSATGTDDTSGLTGNLVLKEQLTYKTTLAFEAGRAIQSYVLTSGSEIDSSLGISAEWQATHKLRVSLGYKYIYRDYPGQGNNPIGSERVDIQNAARLEINYQPREWLSIRPYANFQWRISNYIGGEFNANIFGVAFTVHTRNPKK
jgi:Putative beta-barrel porin 2